MKSVSGGLDLCDETLASGEASPTPGVRETGPERVAQFIVLERIGAGGMGVVYAAYDPHLDRRVALKLVDSSSGGEAAKIRLLREAQGMARISHPNVVPVFEAGTHGDAVWLAMELVKGGTLAQWLEAPRDWREVVGTFVAAGRGLAAAHAVGLIHRDFKPDNVLIGEDGRPQVADFGLVRPAAATSPQVEDGMGTVPETHPDLGALPSLVATVAAGDSVAQSNFASHSESQFESSSTGLSTSITQFGALLGTPKFMAPEQMAGEDVGPYSDQFAFCVALYRALFDQPPFDGGTVLELATNVLRGKLRSPPSDTPVPRKVVDAVMRGLAREPGNRFSGMDELLEALAPPAPRRWGVAIGGALALTGVAAALFFGLRREQAAPLCVEGEARIEGVWDDERRANIEAGFSDLGLRYGQASFDQAAGAVDRWADGWVAHYTDACEATHVRGDQSETALDLRMTCLERHRRTAKAVVDLLENPDAEVVQNAAELVAGLPDSSACDKIEELGAIAAPEPEEVQKVSMIQEALADVRALRNSGRLLDAKRSFQAMESGAASIEHPQTRAQLMYYQALFEDDLEARGDRAAEAFTEAISANDDALALDIALVGLKADSHLDGRRGKVAGLRWYTIADGLSERRGRPVEPELALIRAHVLQLDDDAQFDVAIAEAQRGVDLAESGFGPNSLAASRAIEDLAGALSNAGRFGDAMREYRRASLIVERELGPDHPRLVPVLQHRAMAANAIGEFDEAREDLLRVVELSERVRGPDDPATLRGLGSLGVSYDLGGEHEKAREVFEELLSRLDEREAPRTRNGLEVANSLCFVLYKLDELDEAQELCEATLVGAEEGEPALAAIVLNNLGLVARAKGEFEAALARDREALERAEASLGPGHPATAYSLVGIGESLVLLERYDEAIEPLERALKVRENAEAPGELAEARCLLASALLGASVEDKRARELLDSSAEGFALGGKDWDERAEACAAIE